MCRVMLQTELYMGGANQRRRTLVISGHMYHILLVLRRCVNYSFIAALIPLDGYTVRGRHMVDEC